jgi:diguanylate cyclase (GGDEF)-like protein
MNWRPRLGRILRRHSLRQRYLGVAIFLGCVVVASAVLTERHVSTTSRNSAHNIEARNQIQQRGRAVRNAVWGAEYALQSYVLTPSSWYREAVEANIHHARQDIQILHDHEWIRDNQLQDISAGVIGKLGELERHTVELMDIRVDVDRLFPSASLMDNVLSPANAEIQTALRLALDEIATEQGTARSETYQAFEDIRHSWSQLINAFRLYVVRRSGIYSDTERGLTEAGHDITLLLEQTKHHLQHLNALDSDRKLGLQAGESMRQLHDYVRVWEQGFESFKTQQEMGNWRNDIPLIQETVQPLFAEIWLLLDQIDEQIEAGAEHDMTVWSEVGRRLNTNLLLLSLLAMAFIALGFVFFERTVLSPLSQLTRAMKAIAKGEPRARLPRANSIEARDLLEAFAHMRRTIHERQTALRHQALHDTLTGLPNRKLFRDRLQQTIMGAGRAHAPNFSLLMIDLDRFKEINDTLGHQAGDHVLSEVGARLTDALRRSDTVARLGGDEFAVLLPGACLRQAQEIAQLVGKAIEQPLRYQERELPIGASIGIAIFPDHGDDAESLFKHADVAMYAAKQNGLPYSVYNPQQDRHSIGRLAMISELRNAIAADELVLHYQPKVDMRSGDIVGVEALLRWPQWTAIPTEYLIRTAERTSLIRQLTLWVMRSALAQTARWRQQDIELPVAVNLSTWLLAHTDLDAAIQSLLLEFDVPANQLELEITENAMMKNPEQARVMLAKLHALGIRLTVDDYGTGFSSLAHLKTMPVGRIKIDRSFVGDVLDDEDDAVIVRSTIDLAHNLGMQVVAEGVSSQEIWDLLNILGCDMAQGYFIAQPMPAASLAAWLEGGGHTTSLRRPLRA